MYERDVFLTLPIDHQNTGENVLLRGKFPDLLSTSRSSILSVEGSFRNLTNLVIPKSVSTFLSLGPKFMLPAFTNLSETTVIDDWDCIIEELKRAEYPGIEMAVMQRTLRKAFNLHTADISHTRKIDQYLLFLARSTSIFLKRHQKNVVLVEGDKGKIVGLMPRAEFVDLCENYIMDGLTTGRYVSSIWIDEDDVISNQKELFYPAVKPFQGYFDLKSKKLRLFMPISRQIIIEDYKAIRRMNVFVSSAIGRAIWGVPIFRPSVKYHKTPAKLRPIVSKRHTPSIAIGKAILFALKKIM